MIAPLPDDETERLAVLRELRLLDSPAEPAFDAVARLAATLLDVPIAVVSLVDAGRQWFKARHGLAAAETPRDVAFCAHAILGDDMLVVPDATEDRRFTDNPLVTGELGIRAYAGVPLRTLDGHAIGTLCAIDRKPRVFSARELQLLRDAATIVNSEILSREQALRARTLAERSLAAARASEQALRQLSRDLERRVQDRTADLQAVLASAHDAYICIDAAGTVRDWNRQARATFGWTREEALGRRLEDLTVPPGERDGYRRTLARLAGPGGAALLGRRLELPAQRRDGSVFPCEASVAELQSHAEGRLYAVFLRDIAERKAAEAEIADSHARLAEANRQQGLMLDNELFGIVKLKDRVVTWCNVAYERLFGYAAGELVGRSVRLIYPDEASFARVGSEAYPLLRTGGTYRIRQELVRKDGERFWVDMSSIALAPASGESLWMMQDITATKRHQDKVEVLAFQDALTGLPNRALLFDRLQQALVAAERSGRRVAVGFADLDGFKAVNDRHGHDAGDHVLRVVADRLAAALRGNDTVARLGGDEFVVLLTQIDDRAEVDAVFERIARAVAEPVGLPSGVAVHVSASFGVAWAPQDGRSAAALIAAADAQMYAMKRRTPSRPERVEGA